MGVPRRTRVLVAGSAIDRRAAACGGSGTAAGPTRSSTSRSTRGSATRPTPRSSATCSRRRWASRSSTRTWPSRSAGRASRPARSTPSSRTGATPTSSRPTSPRRAWRSRPGAPASTGSSAGSCRRGWPPSTRTSPTGRSSTATPRCSRRPSPVTRASSSPAIPSFVTSDAGDHRRPGARLRGRVRRQRGGAHRGLPLRRGEQDAAARLLLLAAVVPQRGPAGQDRSAAVDRGLRRRRRQRDHLRLRAVQPARQVHQQEPRGQRRRGAAQFIKNFQWTAEHQNAVSELHHQRRDEPRGCGREVGGGRTRPSGLPGSRPSEPGSSPETGCEGRRPRGRRPSRTSPGDVHRPTAGSTSRYRGDHVTLTKLPGWS